MDEKSKSLLDRITQVDNVALPKMSTRLMGKAISRTSGSLHLAIQTGIVAIPINSIGTMVSLDDSDETYVSVQVLEPERVRYLRYVGSSAHGGQSRDIQSQSGDKERFCCTPRQYCNDTSTNTGPQHTPDATDDSNCWVDPCADMWC